MATRIKNGQKQNGGRPVEYSRELPCYDTMDQCSGATGVPVSVLKVAKKNGCPGFSPGGRIHFSEFVRWWFKRPKSEKEDDDGIDWNKRDKKATALLKEAKLEEQNERTIDFNLARSFIEYLMGEVLFAEFDRYAQEFPAVLKGKDEIAIRVECDRQKEMSKQNAKRAIETWVATKGKKAR